MVKLDLATWRVWRSAAIGLLVVAGGVVATPSARETQAQVPLRSATLTLTSVADWQQGTSDGLLVSNNETGVAGGELRLQDERNSGEFVSSSLAITDTAGAFAAIAIGAAWQAEVPQGTALTLEVRGGSSAIGPWSAWFGLPAGDTRSQNDAALASEGLRSLPLDSRFVQVRATFRSEQSRASAQLRELTLFAFDSLAGPASATGLNRSPVAYGADVLTPRPTIVRRDEWSSVEPQGNAPRSAPKAIMLHTTGSPGTGTLTETAQPLMVLRSLAAYHTESLGWGDLAYHYIIDREGNLYEGRQGGPQSTVTQFNDVGEPAIHVALLADFDEAPTAEARLTLGRLVAWLGQSYSLDPLGEHPVKLPDGSTGTRPNYVAHSEAAPAAPDPGQSVRELMPELRAEADAATVRARAYFAEGNTNDYEARLALYNPSAADGVARLVLPRVGEAPLLQEVPLAAGERTDVVINDTFGSLQDVPLIVEANEAFVVERVLRRLTPLDEGQAIEIDGGNGARDAARVWYFAEGSTDDSFQTFFSLFNVQPTPVSATVTFLRDDAISTTQELSLPPLSRTVVTAGDRVPGVGFGTRILTNQPIVAERTMLFGADGRGFHTAMGYSSLARRWLFAEGTTQPPFAMRVVLLNPNAQPVEAELTFATPDGTSTTRKYALPPNTRQVVNVNDVVPDLGVATTVKASRPILAERALYWNDGAAGTAGVGATRPAFVWRFADGRTLEGDQMFLLVSNPNRGQARVTVDVVLADGARESQGFIMPGNSRYTFAVHEFYPGQNVLAATVRASQQVVVERSLYRQGGRDGGYTMLGVPADE